METLKPCPGKYCGRVEISNGSWSECCACPRGYRTNGIYCLPCQDSLTFYDWLYLLFIAIVPFLMHCISIDYCARKKRSIQDVRPFYVVAMAEVTISALLTVLLVEPFSILDITSCRPRHIADWYTLFHNPNPDYNYVLHCAQEAVYPLYSMVFIFYAFGIGLMAISRPLALHKYPGGKMSLYSALYFYPILAVVHATLGGIIYYSYPYLIIIGSLISTAVYFAYKEDQSMVPLIKSCFADFRNVTILFGHWLMHAFGIVAVAEMKESFHYALLALVPVPTIFYICTVKFTDPTKLHTD